MNEKLFIWCFISIISILPTVVYATSCSVNVCQNGGTCSTSNTDCAGYTCTCVPSGGWYGFNCSLTCSTAGGKPGNRPCITGSCNDGTGTCDCSGNNVGYQCEQKTWCPQPCQNGATCTSSIFGSGTQCDPYIFNQGYCGSSNGVGGFDCPGQFIGTFCNVTKFCTRTPSYCQNGGTCNNPDYHSIGIPFTGTAAHDSADAIGSCTCLPGYSGPTCLTDINECASSPCQHGGTCIDYLRSYNCTCPPGFTGIYCQTDLDECVSNPCKNGGTCVDQANKFACLCGGYSGIYCETEIDECASNPCGPADGGICTDAINQYQCTCAVGSAGTSSCLSCSVDHYADQIGQTLCTACPAGHHQPNTGQSSCSVIPVSVPSSTAEDESVSSSSSSSPLTSPSSTHLSGLFVWQWILIGIAIVLFIGGVILIIGYIYPFDLFLPPSSSISTTTTGNIQLFSGPPFEDDPLIYNSETNT